jgi:hypothetical protein
MKGLNMKSAVARAVVLVSLFAAGCSTGEAQVGDQLTNPADPTSTTAAASTTLLETTTTAAVTTTTGATTTTVPPLDGNAVAFIENWARAMNDGDHLKAGDIVIAAEQWDAPGESDEEREANTRTFFEIHTTLESQFSVDECQTLSSGVTRCRISRTAAPIEAIHPHPETNTFSVRLTDAGKLAYASLVPISTDPWWSAYGAFRDWVSDTHGRRAGSPFIQLFVFPQPAEYPEVLEEQVTIWRSETGS